MARSIYSDAQWEWVAERYHEGWRLFELAEFLGLTPQAVGYHMKKIGVKPRTIRQRLYSGPLIDLFRQQVEFNSLI